MDIGTKEKRIMKEKWKEFKEKCRGLKQHIKEMEGKKKAAIVACAVALCLAVGGAGSLAATYGDGGNASTTKTADKKETTKWVTAKAESTDKSSKDEKKTTAKKVDAKTEDTKKSDETKTDKEEKKTDAKSDSKDSKSEDKKEESGSSSKSDSSSNKDKNSGNSSKPSSGSNSTARKPSGGNNNSTEQKPSGGNNNSTEQKPSGGNNNSGNTSKPSSPETKPSVPVHTHNWVERTHTVHHEATGHNEQYVVSEAWDEQKSEPIYEMVERSICNTCGADITGFSVDHILNGDCGGYHSEWEQVQTGTNNYTVHHDAVYGTRWVQDSAAWDETVSDGYTCSGCGATK